MTGKDENKKISKEWYHWTISKQVWDMVRPFIKIIQEESMGTLFNYSISDCYDRKCLSMYLDHFQFVKMDMALRNLGDLLDEAEASRNEVFQTA